jgi:hypothetical protein
MHTDFLPSGAVHGFSDLGLLRQLKEQQANFEFELEKQETCLPALRDRHGEALDLANTYIEWLSDALHETYCHEDPEQAWGSIEIIQDETEAKAPALLEELEEQNRTESFPSFESLRSSFSRGSKNKVRRCSLSSTVRSNRSLALLIQTRSWHLDWKNRLSWQML